jgi:hypothetical protein
MRDLRTPFVVLLALSLQATGWCEPRLSGRVYGEWYQSEPRIGSDSAITRSQGFLGTQVYGRELVVTGSGLRLDGFTSLRATHDFARAGSLDPTWFLFQGYLQGSSRDEQTYLRVGRQFMSSGVSSRLADGLNIQARLHAHVRLRAFLAASVDPLEPQNVHDLADRLWSGGRLTYLLKRGRIEPGFQLEKRDGQWLRQIVGADLGYRRGPHGADLRLFYNFVTHGVDELRAGYSVHPVRSWYVAARYQWRQPRVTLWNIPERDRLQPELEIESRSTASLYLRVNLGRATTVTAEGVTVFAGGSYALRYSAALLVGGLGLQYARLEGDGPLHDRISLSYRRNLVRHLTGSASLSLSQYTLAADRQEIRASAGTVALAWRPFVHWDVVTELQALENDLVEYDVRGYARLQYSFGGGL